MRSSGIVVDVGETGVPLHSGPDGVGGRIIIALGARAGIVTEPISPTVARLQWTHGGEFLEAHRAKIRELGFKILDLR